MSSIVLILAYAIGWLLSAAGCIFYSVFNDERLDEEDYGIIAAICVLWPVMIPTALIFIAGKKFFHRIHEYAVRYRKSLNKKESDE